MPLCPISIGADFKITPKNKEVLIEINGSNACLLGYRRLHGAEKLIQRAEMLLETRKEYQTKIFWVFFCETPEYQEMLSKCYSSAFGDPLNAINPHGLKHLFIDKQAQRWWADNEHLAPAITCRTDDETTMKHFLSGLFSKEAVEEGSGNRNLIDEQCPYVVVKRMINSIAGRGVRVHQITASDEVAESMRTLGDRQHAVLLEGFVPSKPILNSATGKHHDGCMRLHADYIADTSTGNLETLCELSYWRLCPAALDSDASLDEKFKANIHGEGKAVQEQTTEDDHSRVKTLLDQYIKNLMHIMPKVFDHMFHEGRWIY